ncbi:UNVERIFIED_CONTAM: protein yipf5, putative [Hammondia hammondi]|eukprot:XP_008885389.1 protein yipf5, putative [Hammondia hammondi]
MDPSAAWKRTSGTISDNASLAREGNMQPSHPSVAPGSSAVSTPPQAVHRNGVLPSTPANPGPNPSYVSPFHGSQDKGVSSEQPWTARPTASQFSSVQHPPSSYPSPSYPPSASYPSSAYPPSAPYPFSAYPPSASYPSSHPSSSSYPTAYPSSSYPPAACASSAQRGPPGQGPEATLRTAEDAHAARGKSMKEHQEFLLQKQLERQRETEEKEREQTSGGRGLSFYTQAVQGQHATQQAGRNPGVYTTEATAVSPAGGEPHQAASAAAVEGRMFVSSHDSAPALSSLSSLSSLGLSGSMTAGGLDTREATGSGFLGRLFSFGTNETKEQNVHGSHSGFSASVDRNAEDEIGEEPPLLEELGIHPEEVVQRFKSVVLFYKVDHDLLVHSDMCGPLVVAVTLAFLLLMSGKASFSHIYGLSIVGSLCTYVLLNLMSPKEGIDLYSTISILGYSLLPVVLIAFASIFISLKTSLGVIFSVACVLWCTATASRFFESALRMHDQRFLVAYPISLFYASFVVIAVL